MHGFSAYLAGLGSDIASGHWKKPEPCQCEPLDCDVLISEPCQNLFSFIYLVLQRGEKYPAYTVSEWCPKAGAEA